jgi:hypothetical protein
MKLFFALIWPSLSLICDPNLQRQNQNFDDDPLLTKGERAKEERRGGSGIIKLTKNQNGVWIGRRDIVLGHNIPNYK